MGDDFTERAITFYGEGIKLAGDLRVPAAADPDHPRPGIVCCHGYSGKDINTVKAAIALTAAGYVTLRVDHRGFGKSEGIRGRMLPMEQVADIRSALTFLAQQPEVDGTRLGLWGQSFGGANVSYVAAIDPRVLCTVSLSGIGDGERWLQSLRRYWEWRAFLERLEKDRIRRMQTGESEKVSLFDIMIPDPNTEKYYAEMRQRIPGLVWERPLETAEATIAFKPVEIVGRISPRAIMYIHTDGDHLVPMEESISMYRAAQEPRRLKIVKGVAHQEAYKEPVHGKIMAEAVEWYRTHLPLEPC